MVLQLAQERGLAEKYSEAMFKAFFQDDLDIGHDDVIVAVAMSAGLDRAEVEDALASDERRVQQQADQEHAVNTVGITMVPSVLVDGHPVHGVPSVSRLTAFVDSVTAAREQS